MPVEDEEAEWRVIDPAEPLDLASEEGGAAELFYVLDIGDALSAPLGRFFQPTVANAVGHVASFAINMALWGAGFKLAAAVFKGHKSR